MLLLLLLRTTITRAMGEGERERSWGRKIRKQNLVYRRRSGLGSRDFVPARTTPRSHMGMGGNRVFLAENVWVGMLMPLCLLLLLLVLLLLILRLLILCTDLLRLVAGDECD